VNPANKHEGSSFEDFLEEEGLYEEVYAGALKRTLARLVEEGMRRQSLSKPAMARRMRTSRSQLDRVLDPQNVTIQLDTLIRAATALGCELHIDLLPTRSRRRAAHRP
jgi:antitoxin HicB